MDKHLEFVPLKKSVIRLGRLSYDEIIEKFNHFSASDNNIVYRDSDFFHTTTKLIVFSGEWENRDDVLEEHKKGKKVCGEFRWFNREQMTNLYKCTGCGEVKKTINKTRKGD